MKVSVICPTYQRSERHANLYAAFNQQTYKDKELLIMDDSAEKSPFFSNLQDDRVFYRFLSSRCTVGYKRNLLIDLAQGEIIVHFDDDDFYGPLYIEKMVELIQEADFVKLSKWLAWQEVGGNLWEWDTRFNMGSHFFVSGSGETKRWNERNEEHVETLAQLLKTSLWGYGFSYVYRKSICENHLFDDLNFGEDFYFVNRLLKSGKICKHVAELSHLVLHTLHPQSTSFICPQYHLDTSQAVQLLGEEVKPWLIVKPAEKDKFCG